MLFIFFLCIFKKSFIKLKNKKMGNNSNEKSSNKSMTWAIIIGIIILLGLIMKMTEEKKVYDGKDFVPQSQYEKEKR